MQENNVGGSLELKTDEWKDYTPPTDLSKYLPLYKAAKKGDWLKAKDFIDKIGTDIAVTARITVSNDTALHIAAAEGHSKFVEELVKLMTPQQLVLQNFDYETALQLAAVAGSIRSVKAMVEKNPNLTNMRDKYGCIPLLNATNYASLNDRKEDMIKYLYNVMIKNHDARNLFSGDLGRQIICSIIGAGFFDIAYDMIQEYPKLAIERDVRKKSPCALEMMAASDAFLSRNQLTFWDRFICSLYFPSTPGTIVNGDMENPQEETSSVHNSTRVCQRMGKVIWKVAKRTIPGSKILEKKVLHDKAVKLMKCIIKNMESSMKPSQIIDYFKSTNILDTAIDFGAVELVTTHPNILFLGPIGISYGINWVENSEGRGIFYRAIKVRQEKIFNLLYHITGFKKKFAALVDKYDNTILHMAAWPQIPSPFERPISCIAFAGANESFNGRRKSCATKDIRYEEMIRGRTAQDLFEEEHRDLFAQGEKWIKDIVIMCLCNFYKDCGYNTSCIPIFLHKDSFVVFAVVSAPALLTSEYEHDDFLKVIPKKLMLGLGTLLLGPRYTWLPIPLSLVASIPVSLFLWSYVPLFINMVHCAYGRKDLP
ncbi:hypothetical protein MKW92_021973 [Papaver armeniacum]|nr:hypothetical protein MKW92_021973 [Papaver armeniacum]